MSQIQLHEQSRRRKRRHPRRHFCKDCVVDLDAKEQLKYLTGLSRGELRPALEEVTCNIWKCPKCNAQYLHGDFYGGNMRARNL